MKRKFFVINETGGYFGGWEEELCKAFARLMDTHTVLNTEI